MVSATALHSLPQDQLALAYSQETRELYRYRGLTLCFLPFDLPVSRLMSAIGMECEHRLFSLQEVAKQMELVLPSTISQQRKASFLTKNSRHFFVVDEHMGRQVLLDAEEAAEATYTLFSRLSETNATPELQHLLSTFVTQKYSEYRVVKECREQWKIALYALGCAS
ncbi:Bro-N domain-containing protein [Halomonas sp. NYA30]|tara:strand:- start:1210 stop:1710 length:501 start_codon:yes stop_codon:yes gene_type:complete